MAKGIKYIDKTSNLITLKEENKTTTIHLPKFEWELFNKNNPPFDLYSEKEYLVFLREDNYDNGKTWTYHVDIASPYGTYIDDFWDTQNDWREGQILEVIAYAELPTYLRKKDLKEETSK